MFASYDAKVVSGVCTHLLPEGDIEIGVIAIINNVVTFVVINYANCVPSIGEEIVVEYHRDFWKSLTNNFGKSRYIWDKSQVW